MNLRGVVSAATAGAASDLRCEVREHLVGWLARHHPEALPVLRTAPDEGDAFLSDGDRQLLRAGR
jgi:hypothetical protein